MSDAAHTVNIQEAKTHLSRLLREVEAGRIVEIARAGKVIARLVRVEPGPRREWGFFEGKVRHDPDVFEPLSDAEAARWSDGGVEP